MKKISLVLGIIFMILTFAGCIYIFITHGQANAGYALVPFIWCLACFSHYRRRNKRDNK